MHSEECVLHCPARTFVSWVPGACGCSNAFASQLALAKLSRSKDAARMNESWDMFKILGSEQQKPICDQAEYSRSLRANLSVVSCLALARSGNIFAPCNQPWLRSEVKHEAKHDEDHVAIVELILLLWLFINGAPLNHLHTFLFSQISVQWLGVS